MTVNIDLRHILTIDVEDWFSSSVDLFKEADTVIAPKPHKSVISNTINSIELLKKNSSKATFFILTTICEHYPELIQEIRNQGHEIGVHGYDHRLLYNLTKDEFKKDLDKSLSLLAKCGITSVKGYRAPYWSITEKSLWVIDILMEYGFTYDSSIFPIKRGLYGIPDSPILPYKIKKCFWEFPPTTIRIFNQNIPVAGGGYLRLLPLNFILYVANKMLKDNKSGVFYFHPYELDAYDTVSQVKFKNIISYLYYLQQIAGRKKNIVKLTKFLNSFKFIPIETAIANMENKPK